MALKTAKVKAKDKPAETEVEEAKPEIEVEHEEETGTAVATVETESTALSTVSGMSGLNVDADKGFENLVDHVGFGSFKMVKLDKKEFVCDDLTFDKLDVQLLKTVNKYLYKARKGEDDDIPIAYSYDDVHSVSGTSLEDIFREWREDEETPEGEEPIRSVYIEAMAAVHNTGTELDGEIVLLNIAPSSKSRLAGYSMKVKIKTNGKRLDQVITRCQPGPKLTVKGSTKTFYPWDFQLVGVIASD